MRRCQLLRLPRRRIRARRGLSSIRWAPSGPGCRARRGPRRRESPCRPTPSASKHVAVRPRDARRRRRADARAPRGRRPSRPGRVLLVQTARRRAARTPRLHHVRSPRRKRRVQRARDLLGAWPCCSRGRRSSPSTSFFAISNDGRLGSSSGFDLVRLRLRRRRGFRTGLAPDRARRTVRRAPP